MGCRLDTDSMIDLTLCGLESGSGNEVVRNVQVIGD